MPIKYITKKYHRQIFFTPKKPLIVRLRNRDVAPGTMCPGAHFCVRKICIYTNNAVPIKYLPKTQIQFAHPYSQYNISKISPTIFPLGGDTPFCAFGYEIIDFYLTRKKTGRRYGRCLFESIFKLFIHVCLSISHASGRSPTLQTT